VTVSDCLAKGISEPGARWRQLNPFASKGHEVKRSVCSEPSARGKANIQRQEFASGMVKRDINRLQSELAACRLQ
jgi:hypothetical protein